jgi:pimeloyl-ACP methyl ester carboxylesterase
MGTRRPGPCLTLSPLVPSTTPTVGRVQRGGVALHYAVSGSGRDTTPLVLTHGFAASSAMWTPNLGALCSDRTVVTWDLRGHGHSDSPRDQASYTTEAALEDLRSVLDACGLDRVALGGHSLGGFLSLAFAGIDPTRVAALLLFATGPGFSQEQGRHRWNQRAEAMAAALDSKGLGSLAVRPEVSGDRQNPVGLATAARGMLTQHDDRVITSLPTLLVPALIVVGEHDHQFRPAAAYLAQKLPHATPVTIAQAGHMLNVDQPNAFNQAVTRFLTASIDTRKP